MVHQSLEFELRLLFRDSVEKVHRLVFKGQNKNLASESG